MKRIISLMIVGVLISVCILGGMMVFAWNDIKTNRSKPVELVSISTLNSTHNSDLAQSERIPDKYEICAALRDNLGSIFIIRQGGDSMPKAVDFARSKGWDSLVPLIPHAYEYPIFGPGLRHREAYREYVDKYYGECLMTLP